MRVVSSGAKAVAAGSRHTLMLKQDGSVWGTGYNEYGQLGDGSTADRHSFVQVIPGGVKVVAAGAFHSMALMQDGSVRATGPNFYGQYGDGSTKSGKTFARVSPHKNGTTTCTGMLTSRTLRVCSGSVVHFRHFTTAGGVTSTTQALTSTVIAREETTDGED